MIFIDIDGPLVDFYGTAKKFGVELKINEFGKWKWGEPGFPAPEEFYAKAEPQPWAEKLIDSVESEREKPNIITKDFLDIKEEFLDSKYKNFTEKYWFYQSANKRNYCSHPIDLLIDDNLAECEAWRKKGGMAWHFDLASETPFEDFLKFWRNEK